MRSTFNMRHNMSMNNIKYFRYPNNNSSTAVLKASNSSLLDALKPRDIVNQLDKFIVGQLEAKKAVAIAMRNRWRRHQLSDSFRNEVIPKNILMIGPTGCGKTEIARRIAKLSQAPFIKVEATKFTEVGFHGKDVDQIIRDLLDISINMTKKRIKDDMKIEITKKVEERIVRTLIGKEATDSQYEAYLTLLREGGVENQLIEIPSTLRQSQPDRLGLDASNPAFAINEVLKQVSSKSNSKSSEGSRKVTVAEARAIFEEDESEKVLDNIDINKEAIAAVEESGIVFIDEIDKLVSTGDYRSADASSEGVQRDLLPLIEGSSISTKHGNVNTDFILFIASGAFHSSKPSDLLAELQGRLPIRVALKGLTQDDLYRILTEPVTNLIQQQKELLKAEKFSLSFTDEAIREIAKIAYETNQTVENIGARRLHTVIEKIVEDISFDASDKSGECFEVTEEYVRTRISDLMKHADLKKYIL